MIFAETAPPITIRIEPDWNVNLSEGTCSSNKTKIRIEPDWNVNDRDGTVSLQSVVIRIEPDWNVNQTDNTFLPFSSLY